MIGFYHEYDEYGCFSNWYHAEFDYAGKHYANSEQYMMYQKVWMFKEYDLADQIMQTADPQKCKNIARQPFSGFDSKLWDRTSKTIVKRSVRAKFQQNEDILKILLNTGNELLAECSPRDKKWGIGIDISDPNRFDVSKWKGDNYLGRVLMEVRAELRQELAQSGKMEYIGARELPPIKEWKMTAGELRMIPQYYDAVHAYSEVLDYHHVRPIFYNDYSLEDWDIAMRTNMGGGLPIAGFYEMKQDIYDITRRLNGGILEFLE